jgi:phosphatidylserine/phosphatidylglycerophosphate/cardiolipin synthase-like enzyme
VPPADWFLDATERGNPWTCLDSRHADRRAWTSGNRVRPLVHGADYFAELLVALEATRAGDLVMFAGWRMDADQRLGPGRDTGIAAVLSRATRRGVDVRGLLWRSQPSALRFFAVQNAVAARAIGSAGGQCLLDMRVRPNGSHHQKFFVLRHPGRSMLDIAFLGGIDVCRSRGDDADHSGDPQTQPMPPAYGPTPAWHDIQLAVTGPAVGDVEAVFRERWDDPAALTRSPVRRLNDRRRGPHGVRTDLPPQAPDPSPTGTHAVQLLRTYPRRRSGYAFAPEGERSVARGYEKALHAARRLVYVEDQYLWSSEVAAPFAQALRDHPDLQLVVVLPHYPDRSGRHSLAPNAVGRDRAVRALRAAGGDRVMLYGLENLAGTAVYVHAKVCVIDDLWASVGSDNLNRRSWTHDSELTAAVWDEGTDGASPFAVALRRRLAAEHLGLDETQVLELDDPAVMVRAFAASAARLQAWHDAGRPGPRPPGRLRPVVTPHLTPLDRAWGAGLYDVVYDPDGNRRAETVRRQRAARRRAARRRNRALGGGRAGGVRTLRG